MITTMKCNGKRLVNFPCGHWIVTPGHIPTNCPACKVGRTVQENKERLITLFPELRETILEVY